MTQCFNLRTAGLTLVLCAASAGWHPLAAAGSYTVRQGDTLWSIADYFETSVEHLRAGNGIGDRFIQPGETLTVAAESEPREPQAAAAGEAIGEGARRQMERLVAIAQRSNAGASLGNCFAYVWRYVTTAGYGKLDDWNDASDMPSAYARNFADYMNTAGNAARWGLRRLLIDNPYDAPRGAIVVVAPGSPGTSNPVAGDISVATGEGRFINDGPNMSYGSRSGFRSGGGRLLGAYVPMD